MADRVSGEDNVDDASGGSLSLVRSEGTAAALLVIKMASAAATMTDSKDLSLGRGYAEANASGR